MAERGRPRALTGKVVSDKMMKTVVVEVTRRVRDPRYGKYVSHRTKLKAHDEAREFRVGDSVLIREFRPIASDKRWKVVRLIERPEEA